MMRGYEHLCVIPSFPEKLVHQSRIKQFLPKSVSQDIDPKNPTALGFLQDGCKILLATAMWRDEAKKISM